MHLDISVTFLLKYQSYFLSESVFIKHIAHPDTVYTCICQRYCCIVLWSTPVDLIVHNFLEQCVKVVNVLMLPC